MSDIETRLRKIIDDHLAPVGGHITREASIEGDLGADSLDTVELHYAAEDEFGITIEEDEWAEVVTFGDAVDLVTRVLG